jgi:hypothetical protein
MRMEVIVVVATEEFPRTSLALQVLVAIVSMTASIPDPTVGDECWKLDLEVVATRIQLGDAAVGI